MTDYYIMVLHQKERDVFITFAIVCLSSPCLGAICGGWISKTIGGLASPRAYYASCIVAFINCGLSLFLPVSDNFWVVTVIFWSNLFGGGILVVLMYGLILNSLEIELRPQGNALSQLAYNLFGWMPSPWIYGQISEMTGGNTSRWGMIFNVCVTIPACFLVCVSIIIRGS